MLDTVSLCCRIVLNIPLTAGGTRVSAYGVTPPPPHGNAASWGGRRGSNVSRSGAFGRQSRTKAQAIWPWIHGAFRPCGTRAAFATNIRCRPYRGKTTSRTAPSGATTEHTVSITGQECFDFTRIGDCSFYACLRERTKRASMKPESHYT